MQTQISDAIFLNSLADVDIKTLCRRQFTPSPSAWEDQVMYFLLPDRFSDANETDYVDNEGNAVTSKGTHPYTPADCGNAVKTDADAARWRESGKNWCGGSLKGLAQKMGYLKRLGVTAIWVGPVFKQVADFDTYHGYAIQSFLDVDPHFGTREDLREMVATAHAHGIYVVLDIVINHAANVFGYDDNRPWDGMSHPVAGFYNAQRQAVLPLGPLPAGSSPEAGIRPTELQRSDAFHQRGYIKNWDFDPEFRDGDFNDLKDFNHGWGTADIYNPSPALRTICDVYKYWIAYADLDGFRVDTVKHVDDGAARLFASTIHEFAQSIGKDDFYLIAEIAGNRKDAYDKLELIGMDAALGIADVRDRLGAVAKGYCDPMDYFGLFRNSILVGHESHTWFRNKVVTMCDDHDLIGHDPKARFCSDSDGSRLVLNVLAMNATTLGIPCIYYGTEQRFDGSGGDPYGDRYIREAMFGGSFGAFRSRERHFFNEETTVYRELAKIHRLRSQRIALRRGRQYLRQISGDGMHFGDPIRLGADRMHSVVAWSRLMDNVEILCAMNTDANQASTAWVTLDDSLHSQGQTLACAYSTDSKQIGHQAPVELKNGKAARITIPAAGFVVYE